METIRSKKHKKKTHHIILFTSDAVNAKIRQIRMSPAVFHLLVLVICIAIGVAAGYIAYGGMIYDNFRKQDAAKEATIAELKLANDELVTENQALTDKVGILSETVNQKVQEEQEQEAQKEEMSMPTEFPLTGSATVSETTTYAEQPICIFEATDGITAVASGNGIVTAVEEDVTYGYKVSVDHGNGYVSIYLNQASPKVKAGDEIARGTTIYVISDENTQLGYQMTKDGEYINPMEMIAISG